MSLENLFKSVQKASRSLAVMDTQKVNTILLDLADTAEREIPFLRRKLGVVFQDFKLMNELTVKGNLCPLV